MYCTLETNWQGILGKHGQFTFHLPSLGPRCQILKVAWHRSRRGVSKSHSWQPALANVSGWSWSTCLTTNMLILILVYFYRGVLKDWNSLLDIATGQEILSSWARMQERSTACNKTEFRRWSQASGTDYSQHSLLLSDKLKSQNLLRPITQYMHDAWLYAWALPKWCAELGWDLEDTWLCATLGPACHSQMQFAKVISAQSSGRPQKKLGNSNAHPQRFWVCTRSWHTMS